MSVASTRVPRSRERIEELVQSRLRSSPYPSIQRLKSRVRKGRVVLRGRVPTFFEKQIAQESIADLDGIEQVENRVEVA